MSTWPFLRVSLPRDQPVRYLEAAFSSFSVNRVRSWRLKEQYRKNV